MVKMNSIRSTSYQMLTICRTYLARACSRTLPVLTVDILAGSVGVAICLRPLAGVREFLRGVLGV